MEMTISVIAHAEEFLRNFETNVTSQESSSYADGLGPGMAFRMLPSYMSRGKIALAKNTGWMLFSENLYEKKTRRVLAN